MDFLVNIAALLMLLGIPALMLACSTLPYGERYVIANVSLLSVVGLVLLQQAMAYFNEVYGVAVLLYGVMLTLWALILHVAKALKFAARRVVARRLQVAPEGT